MALLRQIEFDADTVVFIIAENFSALKLRNGLTRFSYDVYAVDIDWVSGDIDFDNTQLVFVGNSSDLSPQ